MGITVFEVQKNGDIKELVRVSCGDCGGSSVDKAFKSTLAEIVTEEMLESYSKNYPIDYLDLFKDFEFRKRSCQKGKRCYLTIPHNFKEKCSETFGTDLATLINNSKYKDNLIWTNGKIKIKSFETFFQLACDKIIRLVEELFQSPKFKDVSKIVMAGGFSESCIFQEALRDAFPNCQVVVPEEAGLAVLRGAVLLGFHSGTKPCRVLRHTYGVDKDFRFDPAVHEESKKEVID